MPTMRVEGLIAIALAILCTVFTLVFLVALIACILYIVIWAVCGTALVGTIVGISYVLATYT